MPEAVACARLDVINMYSLADMQGSWNVSHVGLFISCYYNLIECQGLEVYSPVCYYPYKDYRRYYRVQS